MPNQTCLTSCWVGKRAGEGKTQKLRGREGICLGSHEKSIKKKKKWAQIPEPCALLVPHPWTCPSQWHGQTGHAFPITSFQAISGSEQGTQNWWVGRHWGEGAMRNEGEWWGAGTNEI